MECKRWNTFRTDLHIAGIHPRRIRLITRKVRILNDGITDGDFVDEGATVALCLGSGGATRATFALNTGAGSSGSTFRRGKNELFYGNVLFMILSSATSKLPLSAHAMRVGSDFIIAIRLIR